MNYYNLSSLAVFSFVFGDGDLNEGIEEQRFDEKLVAERLRVGLSLFEGGCEKTDGESVWMYELLVKLNPIIPTLMASVQREHGLDRRTTASMFADAKCVGEKKIIGEDFFILKLCADPQTLKARSEGPAEIIRHVAHTAKGPVRPLRRALQAKTLTYGLDSRTTASMFADAKWVCEKINGEDCFILKLCADPQTLKARSEGPAEIIRHETTINSSMEDYRAVEGIMIAHSGHSVATLFRFGEMSTSHTKTRMEEAWSIEEVAFNVHLH
ncbi:protoheme IX farnesyltransferase [Tanacetum coccineum]